MESFGEALKRERESREISLREIAEATKINIRFLEALEQDRFDTLPGGIFNRGFIRAYASFVGLDAGALLQRYAEETVGGRPESTRAPATAQLESPLTNAPGLPDSPHHSTLDATANQPKPGVGSPNGPAASGTGVPGRGVSHAVQLAIFMVVAGGLLTGTVLMLREDSGDLKQPERFSTAAYDVDDGGPAQVAAPAIEHDAQFDPPPGMFVDAAPVEPAPVPPSAPTSIPEAESRPPVEPRESSRTVSAGIGAPPAQEKSRRSRTPEPQPEPPPRSASRSVVDRQPDAAPAEPATTPKAVEAIKPAPMRPAAQRPPPGPMMLHVEVSRETWLWLSCDSQTAIDRRVRQGESAEFECLRSIRVSAHDGGAVILTVNGAPCMPLGEDGSKVYGYTIRFDDAHLICAGPLPEP
jgi:transcriptional regulator with XRE-family HTH domain